MSQTRWLEQNTGVEFHFLNLGIPPLLLLVPKGICFACRPIGQFSCTGSQSIIRYSVNTPRIEFNPLLIAVLLEPSQPYPFAPGAAWSNSPVVCVEIRAKLSRGPL